MKRISFLFYYFFRENYFPLGVENKVLEAGRIYLVTSKKAAFQLHGFFYIIFNLKEHKFVTSFLVQKYTKLTSLVYISIPMCSAGIKH